MIDPPDMMDQYLTLNFKVKIQPAHGERWLTPQPGMTGQCLT